MISPAEIISTAGEETPTGRMLAYSDARYDLVKALRHILGEDSLAEAATSGTADGWARACLDARRVIEEQPRGQARWSDALEEAGRFMSAVLLGHWVAFRRVDRPGLAFVEATCGGVPVRVELGRGVAHAGRCSCSMLVQTHLALEAAGDGENPWGPAGEVEVAWVGLRSLSGPRVLTLRSGRPSVFGVSAGGPVDYEWGYRGIRPLRLARALLAEASSTASTSIPAELADRFALEVVERFDQSGGFVLRPDQVVDWLDRNAS